jgi:hypothetical protein
MTTLIEKIVRTIDRCVDAFTAGAPDKYPQQNPKIADTVVAPSARVGSCDSQHPVK